MPQIRWSRIELQKARYGWRGYLVDTNGIVWKRFWRPTPQWAYNAAYRYYKYHVWG